MTQAQLDKYVSTAEVAAIFGVSDVRVLTLVRKGRLPYLTTSIGRLYPRAEILAIDEQRRKSARQQDRTRKEKVEA